MSTEDIPNPTESQEFRRSPFFSFPAPQRCDVCGVAPAESEAVVFGKLVRAQILVKEVVLENLSESVIVGYPFVKVEIDVDYFLDDLLHLVVKGNAHVLQGVDPCGNLQRRVPLPAGPASCRE